MPADPAPRQAFRQEYSAGGAEDNGQIVSVTAMADSPFGHFQDVVMTRDTITTSPDVVQFKFYAKGVGPMLVLDVSGGAGRASHCRHRAAGFRAGSARPTGLRLDCPGDSRSPMPDLRSATPDLTTPDSPTSVGGRVPVAARTDLYLERNGEVGSGTHPLAHQIRKCIEFSPSDLEYELVVHLE